MIDTKNFFRDCSKVDDILNAPISPEVCEQLLGLIQDTDVCRYFFQTVSDYSWFEPLLKQGLFDPSTASGPTPTENGYLLVPDWQPLFFLIRMSEAMAREEQLEHVNAVVDIIKAVAERNLDNYRINYRLIMILGNLPSDAVTDELIDLIPIWFDGKYDTLSEGAQICEGLLPKFLKEDTTPEEAAKAEMILKHLLHVKRVVNEERETNFKIRVDEQPIENLLINRGLISLVAKHCSTDLLYTLCDNMKLTLTQNRNEFVRAFKLGEVAYCLRGEITGADVKFDLMYWDEKSSAPSELIGSFVLKGYEKLTEKAAQVQVKAFVDEHIEGWRDDRDALLTVFGVSHVLYNDQSTIWCRAVSELEKSYAHGRGQKTLALILRDLISHRLRLVGEDEGMEILTALVQRYRFPFFKRLALHAIKENWEKYRGFFLQMMREEEDIGYFSEHHYKREVQDLLEAHASSLNDVERDAIDAIIRKGPQQGLIDYGDGYDDHWRLGWYAALKGHPHFEALYSDLSAKTGKTVSPRRPDDDHVLRGNSHRMDTEEILGRGPREIADFVLNYHPKDQWEEGTVYGLATALSKAVASDPKKFENDLDAFASVIYDYAQQIILGYLDAIRTDRPFNLKKVLEFSLAYISQPEFGKDSLRSEFKSMRAEADWVTSAMCWLITDIHERRVPVDSDDLGLMKGILMRVVPKLERREESEPELEATMAIVNHTSNSTVGKTLIALVHYSLLQAKQDTNQDSKGKWEPDMKKLFVSATGKELLDAYVVQGWYIHALNQLDENWLYEQMRSHVSLPDKPWTAMMQGYLIATPLGDAKGFELMSPHYSRVLDNIERFSKSEHGLPKHMALYLLWGHGSLDGTDVLARFVREADLTLLRMMCSQITDWSRDILRAEGAKKVQYLERINQLWKMALARVRESKEKEGEQLRATLVGFIEFMEDLSAPEFQLLIDSGQDTPMQVASRRLFKRLNQLKETGIVAENAQRIGSLLLVIKPKEWIVADDADNFGALVEFIYAQGETVLADRVCDKYGRLHSYEFLRPIYQRYHPE